MKYTLHVIHGANDKDAEYVLKQGRNLIGRSPKADFRLNDMQISQEQCVVFWDGNGLRLRNLSRYGTRVDAQKLEHNREMALTPNNVIKVGKDTEILLMDADNDRTLTSDDFKDASVVRLVEHPKTRYKVESKSQKTENQIGQSDDDMSFLDDLEDTVLPEKDDTIAPGCDTVAAGGDTVAAGGDTVAAGGDTVAAGGDTVAAGGDTVGPGCDTVAAGGDTVAAGGDTVGPGGDTVGPGGDTVAPEKGDSGYTQKKERDEEFMDETAMNVNDNNEQTVTVLESTSAEQTQTAVFDAGFIEEEGDHWLQRIGKVKWPITIVILVVVVIWSKSSGRKYEHLVPESTLDFKYVKKNNGKEKKADVVELAAFQNMAGGTPERDAADFKVGDIMGNESAMFYVICPRSSKMTCRLEDGGNRQVIHTFLGRHENVQLNICLSRKRNRDYLCEEFREAKNRVRTAFEANGFEFHDAMADIYDFTDFLFTEGGGSQNGLRYWQITYTRKSNASDDGRRPGIGVGENGVAVENIGGLGIPDAVNRTWYGVLRFFRNADVYYCLCVEVPDFVRKQAEQFLTANTLLKFQIDVDEWQDNRFVALSWDGSNATQKDSNQIAEDFRSFKEMFEKQVNPQLYSEQEKCLMRLLATAMYNDDTEVFEDVFKLFRILRMERQRNYYNQLRLQWQNAVGTKDEASAHKRIKNVAELVFNKVDDARYNKVRRNEWNQ